MKTMKAKKTGKAKVVPVSVTPAELKMKGKKTHAQARGLVSVDSPTEITQEMIGQRAWSIWMSKGCISGQDEMNWYQAEMELDIKQRRE